MSLTDRLLRPLLSSSARPAVTHYDDAVGSRVELSVATLANWAAKTANWLVEEFDVEPGDPVHVELPAHWQTAGVLLGTWWCGGHVVAEAEGARVSFTGPGGATGVADDTAVVALDPLGRGLGPQGAPDGAFDYLSDARTAGDDFTPLIPVPGDTPALLGRSADDMLTAARARAEELGVGAGDRVLSTREWTLPGGVLDAFVAPLSVGAHVVQVSNPAKLDAHRTAERTTIDLTA
ncbi:TIGR03089 family protein [Saccharomonospora sp. CUA-673]|uniref:TIGR03089 family protein n=1 Tax=Saccharomonospora sp. CUA-673 TaxID=1904969 RepID=UPI000960C89C|nr:TIGR03089 family protein [Saccharomonospora sp. CUA-673]OLT48250.1 TIGR03089 family protein [Saccharomonospora sp. CUA-673]